jgi:hypothetical protein
MPPAARKPTAKKSVAKKATAKPAARKATAKKATAKTSAQPAAPPRSVPQAAASAAIESAQAGVEDAVVRIRELQGQLLETARGGGTAYLLAYEKNLSSMLELTESAAASTQLTWAVTLANNYADFVKRVNEAVLKTGRQALR